jgi:hypothetical protein
MNAFKLLEKMPLSQIVKRCETSDAYAERVASQQDLYKSPPGYMEWLTQVKMCLCASGSLSAMDCYKNGDLIGIKIAELARDLFLNNAPARFLAKEMCEAFMQTPFPILNADVLEVLPYMHIMLPRNCVFDHHGDEVLSLLVKAGVLYPEATLEEIEAARKITSKYFPGAIETPIEIMGSRGIEVATMTASGGNCWQEFIDEKAKSWHNENIKYKEKSGYDQNQTELIMRIAVNSLLVHLYEPELIETDKNCFYRGGGFGGSKEKSALGVTWIGKGFRYLRENDSGRKKTEETKSSVRAHWRRGHWHSYLVNKGRTDRVVKWVKPVYVRGNSATQ